MQSDISQRVAMRIRLLTLLHETENRLDDFIKRAKKNDFDHAGFGPDIETLKQIIVYLHDLGLTADAERLKTEMKEWVFALTNIGFADLARNMSAEEKAAMEQKYEPFPTPSDKKGQRLRKIALIGQAVRLKGVINGLIHACDELPEVKSNHKRGGKVWKNIVILVIVTLLIIVFGKQLGILKWVLATATILGVFGTLYFGIRNH